MIADGCWIEAAEITRSVVGVRARIGAGSQIRDSVILGADYFADWAPGRAPLGIGRNCVVERSIIDKNARIGDGCVIRNAEGVIEAEGGGYAIREGVVIVPKNGLLPAGTRI
jgi:glucose-1-phosphate adenylyltransferase